MIEIDAQIVVLDLDDTLYLERDFARSGYRALVCSFGERVGGKRFADECTALLDSGARGNIFDLALSHCGIDAPSGLIHELVSAYRVHSPKIKLCADASRFLARIGPRPTGLITDGPKEGQWAKIEALGLGAIIDHIVVTEEWGREFSKPHPRSFEFIESCTSSSGRSIVYIADNAAKDFVTPRQRGWRTVQILRPDRIHAGTAGSPDHEADSIIASFDEIELAAPR